MHGLISRLLGLFHWSIFLFLCQSGGLIPPAPFFFLKIACLFGGLLCFHMNCENVFSSSVENAIGNLIGIALNL